MKFRLTTTGNLYWAEEAKKLEKLGFEFREGESAWEGKIVFYKKESNLTVEINNLDELLAFQKEWGDLILSENKIQIYDDYAE